ncbi:hypothetical protein N9917_04375, partial [Deltaproteobacteria bacterium]|nr:hypothetical protein [Deltaproteobacteria bacterium]
MSFKAIWPFLEESALLLETDLGWDFNSTNPTLWAPLSDDAYTYASYPGTHWYMAGIQGYWMKPPPALQPVGQVGCWTFAMKQANPGSGTVVEHREGAFYNRVTLLTANVFALYVRTVFQETAAAPVDPTRWHYYCFKSDMFSNPYKAEFWMDGVMILSGTEAEATPRTATDITFVCSG